MEHTTYVYFATGYVPKYLYYHKEMVIPATGAFLVYDKDLGEIYKMESTKEGVYLLNNEGEREEENP